MGGADEDRGVPPPVHGAGRRALWRRAGPPPRGQFEALVRWVEEGDAPETLDAIRRDPTGNVVRSRPLCQYPLVARYKGKGSTDDADNFRCSKHF